VNDECIHGLGMASACSVCNGRVARERRLAAEPKVIPFWLFERKRRSPWLDVPTAGRDLRRVVR